MMSAKNPDELLNNTSDDLLYEHVYETSKSLDRAERQEQSKGIVQRVRKITSPEFWSKRATPDKIDSSRQPRSEQAVLTPPIPNPVAGSSDNGFDQVRVASPPRAQLAERAESTSAPNGVPQLIEAGGLATFPKKAWRPHWIWLAAVVAITAGMGVSVFIIRALAGNQASGPVHPAPLNKELGLQIEGKGDGVLVGWNRLNPVAQSATGGTLQIDDGNRHRQIVLDPEQVASGSVLYMPATDDVTFRLELRGKRGEAVAESTRVLNGHKRPSEELGAAKLHPGGTVGNTKQTISQVKTPDSKLESRSDKAPKPTPPSGATSDVAQTRPIALAPTGTAPAYVPPRPLRQVMPNQIPRVIASTVEIQVEVKLDRNGQVETARLLRPAANLPPYLPGEVLTAAKQWTFSPATLGGTQVESDYIIVFRIRATGP